jgi:putative alpha-1,2-mannosidase
MAKIYNASPSGFPGDEDQGETSSWYVLSALGLYSVCPGTDEYVIGSPVFNKITIALENGKQFIIEAHNNNSRNVYIQSATLNNIEYNHNWITYNDIIKGGTLYFEMSDIPNVSRGTADADKPFSVSSKK